MGRWNTSDVGPREFREMHAALKRERPRPGGEEFRLMCVLGAYIDPARPFPDAEKVDEICRRFHNLMRRPGTPSAEEVVAEAHHPPAAQVQVASRQEPVELLPPPPGSARGDMPPDWKAAYLLWGVEMRKRIGADAKAMRQFEVAEAVLWACMRREVDGEA